LPFLGSLGAPDPAALLCIPQGYAEAVLVDLSPLLGQRGFYSRIAVA